MQAINLEDIDRPDVVALDKDGQVVLIAEVRGFPFNLQDKNNKKYTILRLIDFLKSAKEIIPFAMLVDTKNILIFRWDGDNISEPILCLNTPEILSYYEPKFNYKQIFSLYLTGLIEAWLRDLAYHWKSEIPPASKDMETIGLLELLQEGITQSW